MTTCKTLATGAALAAPALPGTGVADSTSPDSTTPSASQQCKTLRTRWASRAFGEACGTKAKRATGLGTCVAVKAKAAARTG